MGISPLKKNASRTGEGGRRSDVVRRLRLRSSLVHEVGAGKREEDDGKEGGPPPLSSSSSSACGTFSFSSDRVGIKSEEGKDEGGEEGKEAPRKSGGSPRIVENDTPSPSPAWRSVSG